MAVSRSVDKSSRYVGSDDISYYRLLDGVICYPSNEAKYIDVILPFTVNSANLMYRFKRINLTQHSLLNFSFALNITKDTYGVYNTAITPIKIYDNITNSGLTQQNIVIKDEYSTSNRIQATEINNPYIFPAINSYMIGNDGSTIIKSMNTQSEPLSEGQYGQYPLVVFTNSGIYAMQQGTGEVLFQNIIQLSNLSCVGKSLTVAKGIVFATQDSIFVLFGRNVTNIADKLSAAFDSGFKNDFLNDGIMFGRDNYHNELIIANGTKQVKLINLDSFTISSVKDYSLT